MSIHRLIYGAACLLTVFVVACGAPDAQTRAPTEPATGRPANTVSYADTTRPRAANQIICPVFLPCYSVRLPGDASVPPLTLRRRFTGLLLVAVKVDTASGQLTDFRLKTAVLYPANQDTSIRGLFGVEKPVPDSLASLLPLLEQHIRKLRPEVVVASKSQLKAERNSCEMPAEWIFPIRIR